MTTTQTVDYATIVSYINELEIRIFDFVNHLTKGKRVGCGTIMDVFEGYLIADGKKLIRVALKEPREVITSRTRDSVINSILNDIRQEIRMMKHLETHPYVISLYGVAFEDLKPILVVEYAISTLPDYLAEQKEKQNPVDWPTKSRICSEIADGLHALHQVNIVHGDIKGDNILLFPDENNQQKLIAKISDFGFSSTKASIGEGRGTGMTPIFCAPECTKNAPAEIKLFENKQNKDNYSYGLLVWQIANDGDEPFIGMESEKIDEIKHSDKELNILMKELDEDTPEVFRTVITGMTRYNPEDRISFVDVREIMSSNDDTRYLEAKAVFEAAVLELPRVFRMPTFNSIHLMALSTPVKSKIIRSYEKAASNGDAEASCFLSKCYGSGFGVEMNKEKMILFAIKAAEMGNLEAVKLIASYYDVYFDLKDYASLFFPWLMKAAETGHQRSISNVKLCYWYGTGVKKNPGKYLEWNEKEKLCSNLKNDDLGQKLQLKHTLHRAAYEGSLEMVRFILRHEKLDVNLKDDNGCTAMHVAAKEGHINIVQLLLVEFGADVNAKDIHGQTPLHLAARSGHIDIIKFLVTDFQADVEVKTNNGYTPLHEAANNGHINIIKLLVTEYRADMDAKGDDGSTPLHLAVSKGYVNIIKPLVIECEADVNAKTKNDRTALHLAASNGHTDIIRLLVTEFRAEVNAKRDDGWTPLHAAAFCGYIDVIKLLVTEFRADVNAKGDDSWTPLHVAAFCGHTNITKLLVELGADVNAKGDDGLTPLHEATNRRHIDIIKLFEALPHEN